MADALVSGASVRKDVEVQLLSAAPPRSAEHDSGVLRTSGGRTIADIRLPRAGLVAIGIAGIAVVVVLYWARNLNFYFDEYSFLLNSLDWTWSSYWHPILEHWVTLSALAYRGELAVFGMRTHLPFEAALALLNAAVALLLFALIRRRSGDLLALAAMALVLFMGQGYENILQPFQISVVGSAFFGLMAQWLLEHDGHRRRLLAAVALVAGLMCSGFGLFFAFAVAVRLAVERRWWAGPEVLGPPALAYAAWFLTFGSAGLNHLGWPHDAQTTWTLVAFTAHGVGATFAAVLGADPNGAELWLLVPAAAVLVWWRRRRVEPLALASAAALVVQFLLIGLERSQLGIHQAAAPRYLQSGAVFALVVLADCLRGLPWRLPWRPVFVVALAAAFTFSAIDLQASARGLETVEGIQNAELQTVALFRSAPDLNPDAVLDPLVSPYVTPRRYYEAVDRYGSPVPAIGLAGLDRLPPAAVDQAMRAIFAGSVTQSPGLPPAGAGCADVGGPLIDLEVASGGSVWVNRQAGGAIGVLVWFHGDAPDKPAGTIQAGEGWVLVHIPDTGQATTWRVRLTFPPNAVASVCAAPAIRVLSGPG